LGGKFPPPPPKGPWIKPCVVRFYIVTPSPQGDGRGHTVPQIWRFLFIYAYTVCHRTIKFDVPGTTCRGGACSLSATPPIPIEQSSRASQFLGFSCICAYIL